ncbi:MAG: TRAP transporter small permease [Gammaproteobacteria bacterium]|nr:TRAP transporter small permease [Gammaproteobacteria bacterium]MBL6998374.1 TRAP transporter small permease [Gammaproteobacteria bacterium]
MHQEPTRFGQIIDNIEETSIAVCLGLMTLITFTNVIMRYVFNDNILWAIEVTVFLFAWLVLMGASYGVKKHVHIGVDVVINLLSPQGRKIMALMAVASCLLFSVFLLVGSWNYWLPFITERAWLETDDTPMPQFLMFMADWFNEGERYEKMPRFIPYLALPLGMALMTLRFVQVGWKVATGEVDKIISSHEVEEELAEVRMVEEDLSDSVNRNGGKA